MYMDRGLTKRRGCRPVFSQGGGFLDVLEIPLSRGISSIIWFHIETVRLIFAS